MTNPTHHPLPNGVPNGQQEQTIPPVFAGQISHPAQPYAANPGGTYISEKSFVATWLLAWLLGAFAVDRFYLGKIGTGLLKLFTLSGFGIWWLVDLILVLSGAQRDKQGRKLAGYDQHKKVAWIVTGVVIVLSFVFSSVSNALNGADKPAAVAPVDDAPVAADEPVADASAADVATVQSWADDRFGTFAPVTQAGTGDSIVTLPAGAPTGIVTATHDGSSNFSISVLDASNVSTGQLLVNTIGAYSGTTAYGFNAFGDGVTLQISADGNWGLTIAPVSAAPALAPSGVGDAVFLYDGPAGALDAAHDGASNFVVQEETGKSLSFGLLINEIGTYSGTVPLSAGPSVVSVGADGNWTLQVG